ncbi:MAG: beta-lactamase family protein [Asgard group archaeon]|nr:beta-lactamase family protein [Asgard group archaeon]
MKDVYGIINEIKADIEKSISVNNIVGLAISLVDESEFLWLEGFGFRDLVYKTKVEPDTIFSIQSIGKVFTAVALMRGITKGIISLDDKLIDYYPDFSINSKYGKPQIEKITMRHLLAHYAGFTHRSKVGGEYDLSEPTFEEYIKSIPDTWLRYPIGERFQYSNLGLSLASYCLEKASGINFPEFIQQEICTPLGITTLVYGKKSSEKNPNRAIGYHFGHEAKYSNMIFYGAGGQFASVKDMSRFVQFLLNEGKIKSESYIRKDLLDEMAKKQFDTTDTKKYYGLGLYIDKETIEGLEMRYHFGGGCGYNTYMIWNVEYKVGVIILTNTDPLQDLRRIGNKAMTSLLKYKGVKINTPGIITPASFITKPRISINVNLLKKLEGFYAFPMGNFEFKIKNDMSFITYLGNPIPLYTHSETEFTADIPIGIRFLLDDQNKPFAADVLLEGVIHRLLYQKPKVKEIFGANKKNWKDFEGLYSTTYLGDPVYFAVKVDNGHLKIFIENKGEKLAEYKNNIFFTNDNRAVIFHDKFLYYDNIKMIHLDNPVKPIKELLVSEPKHPFLSKRKLKELYLNLEYLGNKEQQNEIKDILSHIYPEEK